jgi:hypothetical protein
MISILCLRSCSVLGFLGQTVSLKSPHKEESSALSQQIELDTLHSRSLHPSNLSLFKMWLTLVLRAPVSRQHNHTDLLQTVWRPVTLFQHFHCQLNWEALRALPVHILRCSISPQTTTQPCNCYACCWRCSKFISLQSLHIIHILLFQQHLRIHLHSLNINRGLSFFMLASAI